MDRRTYEGHMDWEYQGSGPFDPTSPFTHAARSGSQNVFASPPKPSAQPNLFAKLATPSKSSQHPPPPSSLFSPQLSSRNTAPPFRNPAFTTPRKPFDEQVFSEASGAEDSPMPAETFDSPNDTPDADRMSDVNMGGTITPAKVDKAHRYGKSAFSPKKHTSGRGEIRGQRDLSVSDLVRKRKRHNYDRDVSSVVRHQRNGWDESSSDSDDSFDSRPQRRSRNKSKRNKQGGWASWLHEYPNTPEYVYRYVKLLGNCIIGFGVLYGFYSVVDVIRSDLRNANESARLELMSKMTECQTQYTMNECARKDRPALRVMCEEWYDCMMQNPESIMRVKVTVVQLAEILNEFSNVVHWKSWLLFLSVFLVCILANNVSFGRREMNTAAPVPSSQPTNGGYGRAFPPESTPGAMWVQVQTPRMQRHALLGDETDTDASPPQMQAILAPYTPSGRRSPSKGERSRSPVKYGRSPSKGY